MEIQAVCEFNDAGYLFYAVNYPGAYVRGATENEALAKFGGEIRSYLRWCELEAPPRDDPPVRIVQYQESSLCIRDADSDVLFDAERAPLTEAEYNTLKLLVLRSARDLRTMFESIPNPDISGRPPRVSFYGPVPRTPREMYRHVNDVTAYYTAPYGIETEQVSDLYANRMLALGELEALPDFLSGSIHIAPDGEQWTMRKTLRRFLWHDRIHAKAMWRTASALWGSSVENPFDFIA